MIKLAIVLSVIWQTFAVDFNKDLGPDAKKSSNILNSELLSHDYKFTYNFEQIRKDQPPQVELREEVLGKYLYQHPVTTTLQPMTHDNLEENTEAFGLLRTPIIVPEPHEAIEPSPPIISQPALPKQQELPQPVHPPHYLDYWNYESVYPKPMPPPPSIPKWENLRAMLKKQSQLTLWPNQHSPEEHPNNYWHTYEAPINSNEHESKQDFVESMPLLHISPPEPLQIKLVNDKPAEIPSSIDNEYPHSHIGHSSNIGRGSYKFSEKHVTKDSSNTSSASSTTATSIPYRNGNPPPPVPTLTPWYDGFGR